MRVRVTVLLIMACAVLQAAGANAQGSYPTKPIRFIIPYGPGGTPENIARAVSQHLNERMGQPVFLEHRPGAAQAIAIEAAAKAAPDGHTLLMGTMSGLVLMTATRKSLPYDPFKDISSVTLLMATPFFAGVNASLPVNTIQEFIAYLRNNPGKLFYGSPGNGSGHHLVAELFKMRTGTDMVHVPFKTNQQAQIDLVGGQVQVMFEGPGILPHGRSGKLKILAASSMKRASAAPDLVTLHETVLPGFDVSTWFGMSVPAGVPRPIIDRLNRETVALLRMPATVEKFASTGLEFLPSTPEEMTERIRAEFPLWSKVMRAAGIEPE
ncbi:MAG: Bug family tripartite tricarboxylate transporter substrate binding protein [Burkholderiales bacterium]